MRVDISNLIAIWLEENKFPYKIIGHLGYTSWCHITAKGSKYSAESCVADFNSEQIWVFGLGDEGRFINIADPALIPELTRIFTENKRRYCKGYTIWTTKDNRHIPIWDLGDDHLLNCMRMLRNSTATIEDLDWTNYDTHVVDGVVGDAFATYRPLLVEMYERGLRI